MISSNVSVMFDVLSVVFLNNFFFCLAKLIFLICKISPFHTKFIKRHHLLSDLKFSMKNLILGNVLKKIRTLNKLFKSI